MAAELFGTEAVIKPSGTWVPTSWAAPVAVPVAYTGTVPDPFREGREIIVTVQKQGTRFIGERDSLITKCPSKYTAKPAA